MNVAVPALKQYLPTLLSVAEPDVAGCRAGRRSGSWDRVDHLLTSPGSRGHGGGVQTLTVVLGVRAG